jgi:cystathionine gamma-synthase
MPMIDQITEITPEPSELTSVSKPVFTQIRTRITSLLERQARSSPSRQSVQASDVYLFPTGMASLFYLLRWLPSSKPGSLICWGFAFQSTLQLFSSFGHHVYKHFIAGNELDALEAYAAGEVSAGRPIQALFTEFPSNPLLVSTDLTRLRQVATKYDFLLVVDDTLGSFANIDVLGSQGADVLWSSLTKSFGGYADLMAGSVVLNPDSVYYTGLKGLFAQRYHNDLYVDDAIVLELNSRDYLARSTVLNANALAMVRWLDERAKDEKSTVKRVFHPSVRQDGGNYVSRMRVPDKTFVPGYGCLLSVEFATHEALVGWYNVFGKYVHVGPHLVSRLSSAFPLLLQLSFAFFFYSASRATQLTDTNVGCTSHTDHAIYPGSIWQTRRSSKGS